MNYIKINSNTEEGFQDLVFNIEKYWNDEYGNHIVHARGQFHDRIVGFKIAFRPNMRLGIVNSEFDNTAFYVEGITMFSAGKESDDFVRAISELYEIKNRDQRMKDKVIFTSFALGGNPLNFAQEELKFKVFHDDSDSLGMYAELYINICVEENIIELREKDIEYRKNIIRALTGEKTNIFTRLKKGILKKK